MSRPEETESAEKIYLGDGVYAAIERGMLVLTTEDGYSVTNRIWLENEVYEALIVYAAKRLLWGTGVG